MPAGQFVEVKEPRRSARFVVSRFDLKRRGANPGHLDTQT